MMSRPRWSSKIFSASQSIQDWSMLAAERVLPWVTTAGMVTPIGPSPMLVGEVGDDLPDDRGHVLGGRLLRRGDLEPIGDQLPGGQVDRSALDAAAADVDAEYGSAALRLVAHARSLATSLAIRGGAGRLAHWGHDGRSEIAEATRIVPASAEDIFELLATPAQHALIDGSGTVKGPKRGTPQRLSSGRPVRHEHADRRPRTRSSMRWSSSRRGGGSPGGTSAGTSGATFSSRWAPTPPR